MEASEELGVEGGPVHGRRWHRVMRVGEDRQRVVSAVPITGYIVEVAGMYAEVHPQEEMGGCGLVPRGIVAQGEANIP